MLILTIETLDPSVCSVGFSHVQLFVTLWTKDDSKDCFSLVMC